MSESITLRQWTDVVRRARLGRTVKAVALLLATYADTDGTRVFPGIARVAYEAEITYNVAQRALAALRDAGLIKVVHRATRRASGNKPRKGDEYRLILAADLFERVDVPTPAQSDAAIHAIRVAHQGAYRVEKSPVLHPTASDAEEAVETVLHPTPCAPDDRDDSGSAPHGVTPNDSSAPQNEPFCTPRRGVPPPTDSDTTTTTHSDEGSFADVTTSRATEPDERPARCPHGNNPRYRKGTTIPRCEQCRTETNPPAIAVPVVTGPGRFTKAKCEPHGLAIATCNLCRRGLPGRAAA